MAAVGPAEVNECQDFGPEYRERVLAALNTAVVTERLRELAMTNVASARAEPSADSVPVTGTLLAGWAPAPASAAGPALTAEHGAYRLGGDATVGVSALAAVQYPRWAQTSQMVFTLVMGLSLAWALGLEKAAGLMRDGLLLVASDLPRAMAGALPTRADVTLCEVHLMAATTDGMTSNRPNTLEQRIEWSVMEHQIRAPHYRRCSATRCRWPAR